MALASMAPPFAVRWARDVTVLLEVKPVDGLILRIEVRFDVPGKTEEGTDFIDLMPVQKLPRERYHLLPSMGLSLIK